MNISKRYMLIAIVLNEENQLDCAIIADRVCDDAYKSIKRIGVKEFSSLWGSKLFSNVGENTQIVQIKANELSNYAFVNLEGIRNYTGINLGDLRKAKVNIGNLNDYIREMSNVYNVNLAYFDSDKHVFISDKQIILAVSSKSVHTLYLDQNKEIFIGTKKVNRSLQDSEIIERIENTVLKYNKQYQNIGIDEEDSRYIQIDEDMGSLFKQGISIKIVMEKTESHGLRYKLNLYNWDKVVMEIFNNESISNVNNVIRKRSSYVLNGLRYDIVNREIGILVTVLTTLIVNNKKSNIKDMFIPIKVR